jgi:hypothetical protein
MNLEQIKNYLEKFNQSRLEPTLLKKLNELKKIEVEKENQENAKELWCIEQVYKVVENYLKAYEYLKNADYFNSWNSFDRADIELSFLRKHLDYKGNKYNLEFIEKNIFQFMKLFPYKVFLSRESITIKERCSICNLIVSIRKPCGHKIGEIYNGEQCCRVVEEFEILGWAMVTDPFDRYTVLFPKTDVDYNYYMLEHMMTYLKDPFEKWDLEIEKETDPRYKKLGRNDRCICDSGEKYKKCCMKDDSKKKKIEHYKILFHEQNPDAIKPLSMRTFRTMKSKK